MTQKDPPQGSGKPPTLGQRLRTLQIRTRLMAPAPVLVRSEPAEPVAEKLKAESVAEAQSLRILVPPALLHVWRTRQPAVLRSIMMGAAILGILQVIGLTLALQPREDPTALHLEPLQLGQIRPPLPRLDLEPLDDKLRAKGFHECNPHDPLGLGPYASPRNLSSGRILIPQRGGHTADFGYDVLIHFHGHRAARIYLAQTALGVAYAGVDYGTGSGPYERAFRTPLAFNQLLESIEKALKEHSGDQRAHIRHVGLSAWSAGYGAIRQILKLNGDGRVDAIVLLDALHASWNRGARKKEGMDSANSLAIKPIFDFARKASRGEKIFIFTHSDVDPKTYPSTKLTADLLLAELELNRSPVDAADNPFGQTGTVHAQGLHVWSFKGRNEIAHCDQLRHVTRAVRDVLEEQWKTPPMDRTAQGQPKP